MEQKKENQQKRQKKLLYNVFIGLAVFLGIMLLVNVAMTYSLNSKLAKDREDALEKLRPAKIELLKISDSKCHDCFDISLVTSALKESNVNITSEKQIQSGSKEGKDIIAKYNIGKLPALVVKGEINKITLEIFDNKDDALVFAQPAAPYVNVSTGNVVGRVILYHLKDSSCDKCNDLLPLIENIKSAGVKIASQRDLDVSSAEGKNLISKYGIDFAPSMVLSKDADAYLIMQQAWSQLGTKEKDGSYVMRTLYPPIKNLTNGKVAGLVRITYLTDKSCTECYDVKVHKEILSSPQSYSMKLDAEETYDVSDAKGKELLSRYSITQVPTVILSSDASVYPSSASLKQFFSVEKDGNFVFRKPSAVGAYMDLESNTIVKSQQ